MEEVEVVDLHGEHFAWVVLIDELIVEFVEVFQIIQLYLLLVFTSTLLDVFHQMRNGGSQVNHQVGHTHHRHHRLKQFHIALEIAVIKVAHRMIVRCEDIDTLKDASVLDNRFFRLGDGEQVLETLLKEIHLQGKRPSGDVLVVVFKIWVEIDRLKLWRPAIVLGEQMGERGLSAANISCNDDVHGKNVGVSCRWVAVGMLLGC